MSSSGEAKLSRTSPINVSHVEHSCNCLPRTVYDISGELAILEYVRMSTKTQSPAMQIDALKAAGSTKVYTDHGGAIGAAMLTIIAAFTQLGDDQLSERTRPVWQ